MNNTQITFRKTLPLFILLLSIVYTQKSYTQSSISGSSVTIIGTSYTDTGAGNMTLKLPNNTQNGDVTFLFMGQSDSGSLRFPSGWREITDWGRPSDYNDVNLKTAYFVYKGGSKTFSIGSHKKSLVYAITLRGVDQNNPIIENWTKNDTNNKYLNGDRGGCNRGSDGRAIARAELSSSTNGLYFVAAMYDDPQRDVKIYTNDRYNRRAMDVLRSWNYGDDGLTIGVENTNGQRTDYRYFKGDVCRGGNAEGVVASFTVRPSSTTNEPDYDNDGIPDTADTDDDNDGQSDTDEVTCGSNPRNENSTSADEDQDNIPNCVDPDYQEDNDPWLIDNCDRTEDWSSRNTLTLSSTIKEGTRSLKSIGNKTDEFYRSFPSKNMTGATTLEFWYYVSSLNGLSDSNQVELGSAGRNDRDEFSWSINKNNLQVGWNSIKLNLSDARIIGNPDISKLNWFRLYRRKSQTITTRIDHIRMNNNNNTDTSKVIDYCDTIDNWDSHNSLTLSSTLKEGNKSLKSIGNRTDEFYRSFPEKDMNGTTTLEFWYYVSNLNGLSDSNQVELGSAGRRDRDEFSWSINKNNLTVGWNAIKLNINDARRIGNPDISKLNWFRLYRRKNQTVTTRIDYIRMTNSPNSQQNRVYIASPKHALYPNPSSGKELSLSLIIEKTNTTASISIKNMVGQTIYRKEMNGLDIGTHTLNINDLELSPAMYIAEIKTNKSKKKIKFLVVD